MPTAVAQPVEYTRFHRLYQGHQHERQGIQTRPPASGPGGILGPYRAAAGRAGKAEAPHAGGDQHAVGRRPGMACGRRQGPGRGAQRQQGRMTVQPARLDRFPRRSPGAASTAIKPDAGWPIQLASAAPSPQSGRQIPRTLHFPSECPAANCRRPLLIPFP